MEPDTHSIYFKLFVAIAIIFVLHPIVAGYAVASIVAYDGSPKSLIYFTYACGAIWCALGGLAFYAATPHKQTLRNRLLAALLTPIGLSPVIAGYYLVALTWQMYKLAESAYQ